MSIVSTCGKHYVRFQEVDENEPHYHDNEPNKHKRFYLQVCVDVTTCVEGKTSETYSEIQHSCFITREALASVITAADKALQSGREI